MKIADYARSHHLAVGDPLPSEAALASIFNTGRTSLREALAVLEAYGAVSARRGAARVWLGGNQPMSLATSVLLSIHPEQALIDLFEVRQAVETTALPQAAALLTPDDMRTLRQLVAEMVATAERGEAFAEIDEVFHRTMTAPLRNGVIDALLSSYWVAFRAARPLSLTSGEDREMAARHGFVLDAIEAGDTRRAVHELDAHFYGVKNRLAAINAEATGSVANQTAATAA